jgi:predicted NAD/FAD-dependent oxidoreductase
MSTSATAAASKSVAVVGGGVAGLVCARELAARGHRVTVFDLGRAAPGGRASTRTTTWRTVQFDHGAQALSCYPPAPAAAAATAAAAAAAAAAAPSTPCFAAMVEAWRREGLVTPWGDDSKEAPGRVGVYDATTGAYAPRAVWAASGGSGAGAVGSASAAAAVGSAPPPPAPNFFLELVAGAAGGPNKQRPSSSSSPLPPPRLYVGTPSTDALCKGLARALTASPPPHAAAAVLRQGVGVSSARFDPRARTWVLEGRAPEKPVRSHADRRATPAYTPWNEGAFDALVLADRMTGAPGTPGYVELQGAGGAGARLSAALAGVRLSPCLALMLAYESGSGSGGGSVDGDSSTAAAAALPLDGWDAAAVVGGAGKIAWVCREASKPGRARQDGLQTYVAIATPQFSAEVLARAHSDDPQGLRPDGRRKQDGSWPPQTAEYLASLVAPMRQALEEALRPALLRRRTQASEHKRRAADSARDRAAAGGLEDGATMEMPEPAFAQVHRWGGAFPTQALAAPCLRADGAALAACGDFCLGGGIEGAALSGQAAATAVDEMLLVGAAGEGGGEGGGGGGGGGGAEAGVAVAGRL